MNTGDCSSIFCRVGTWWSGLPKLKQDLIILVVGLSLIGAIALIGGNVGKNGFEAWTWHIGG
jgi:hypothetical protein